MEPLISVIVPVYKVETYLRECVDSILNQTYHNLEVILVDDGSPDNCGTICDEYAVQDSRIKVIHKPNGGLSDARNVGMTNSQGDYLMFVDSDDWMPHDSIEYLYKLLTGNDAQLAIGGHERIEDGTYRVIDSEFNGTETVQMMNRIEAMRDMLQNGCASWARLYRREIHEKVLFPTGEINEDEAIVLQILDQCTKVAKSNRIVYQYRCRPESITTSVFSTKKMIWQKHCKANLSFIQQKYPELMLDAAARHRNSILWSLTEIALSQNDLQNSTIQSLDELHKNSNLFWKAPFKFKQDKLRMILLLYGPFSLYRALIRKKRGIN